MIMQRAGYSRRLAANLDYTLSDLAVASRQEASHTQPGILVDFDSRVVGICRGCVRWEDVNPKGALAM